MTPNPLPAQRTYAVPPPRLWDTPGNYPYTDCYLRSVDNSSYLVAGTPGYQWPPPPEMLAHTIEWLLRLTPAPHPQLVIRPHPQFNVQPWQDQQGSIYPFYLAEHLLWLLENPDT